MRLLLCLALGLVVLTAGELKAQSFGIELHNTMMPAAGGMGGVSNAQPQDVTSALNGNPATLTQFSGSQFQFSTGWVDPSFKLTQTSAIPSVGPAFIEPFSASSVAPGTPVGNLGVTQEVSVQDLPVIVGTGMITTGGGFADFRHVPESRGTNSREFVLTVPFVAGVDMTERLSMGARFSFGIGFYDAPFVAIEGISVAYAARGTIGATYRMGPHTMLGAYYQSKQEFNFKRAVVTPGPNEIPFDVEVGLPTNLGWGISNDRLCDGRLLLGIDVTYKLWDDTAFYEAVYDNQWAVQIGAQLSGDQCRLRAGYVWAQNPVDPNPNFSIGDLVIPNDAAAVSFTQGMVAITNQHRISLGFGMPIGKGIDFDVMAGGMFRDEEQFGDSTRTSLETYWISLGVSWQFGIPSCSSGRSGGCG